MSCYGKDSHRQLNKRRMPQNPKRSSAHLPRKTAVSRTFTKLILFYGVHLIIILNWNKYNLFSLEGATLHTMSSPFRIVEHIVPTQHIREYPGATANDQEEPLHLAVKQYIPLDNHNPQPGDITILGAHANGFPKV
jgi:hypothetical protein